MTRAQASARADIARSTWDRIERGSPGVTLATVTAATSAVGLDLVCHAYPGKEPSLRDTGQLEIAQRLATIAAPAWRMSLEQTAGDHGEATDQVLWGTSEVIAIEIERLMVDFQAQYRRASNKRDWLAARQARPVRLVIAIEDTRRNRTAMAAHAPLIESVLPWGTRSVLHSVRTGESLGGDGICWIRRRPDRRRV